MRISLGKSYKYAASSLTGEDIEEQGLLLSAYFGVHATSWIINTPNLRFVPLQVQGSQLLQGRGTFRCYPACTHRPRRAAGLCLAMTDDDRLSVLVTGASGRTGKLVFKKLLNHPIFEGRGLVHSKQSLEKLKDLDIPSGRVSIVDITKGASSELNDAMKGIDAVIICTSAVPRMKSPPKEGKPPEFDYPEGQYPEQVDWIGQKAQIDAAKQAGANQVVVVSSMGGTDKNNRLNALGNGNILIFKRKAEEYLVNSNFPSYTIIHPGGLIDDKGGERELVLGVDDKLMQETSRSIPREDVAELCVQSLSQSEAQNRSIDVISRQPGKGTPTTNFEALFSSFTENCTY